MRAVVAEAHGGRVQLANRPGGGLAVTLILPLVERVEAQVEGLQPKDRS